MMRVHRATEHRSRFPFIIRLALSTILGLWLSVPNSWALDGTSSSCGTPYDTIPNFAFNPSMVSTEDGPWSSPSTWSLGRVPQAQDVLAIRHQVTYDSQTGIADVIGIHVGGSLRFRTDIATTLQVGILEVFEGGTLTIGTSVTPVAPAVTALLIIRNRSLNLTTDPRQFGTGLLSHNGTVTMHGAVKTPTFVRTAAEPRAGHTTLSLEQPVSGWRVGDRIFVPDTRQVHPDNWFNPNWPLQMEERTIQSISADGKTIGLSSALSFDHRGARDANGTATVLSSGIKLLPHVGNLTRNVIIRSENPSGTRGHTLFTLRSAVDLRYVQFQDLGRTKAEPLNVTSNHIGRYPVHMHQLWGPVNPTNTGYQYELIGNAINDSLKWPIAVHGSHFGLIRQNVIYGGNQLTGAGIAVEDGTETENLFEENFVVNIRGDINPRESGPNADDGSTPGSAAECYWAAGFNNRFVNNVASGCRNPFQQVVSGPGWKFIVPAAPHTARNPLFRGADMTDSAQTRQVTPQYQPILEFRGNEVYGLAADGLTVWQLGLDGDPGVMPETVIKDFRVWHTYEGAIWNYPTNRMTIEGLAYRVDPSMTLFMPGAFTCGDYRNLDVTIRGGSIHAGSIFGGCTDPLGTFRFENIDAVTRDQAFSFETPATPGTFQDRPPSGVTMILQNNTIHAWPGQPLRTIEMFHNTSRGNNQPGDNYHVRVYDYQGQAGNNFQAYFGVQATQNLYGGPAPCNDTTTRPEIAGITCPLAPSLAKVNSFAASGFDDGRVLLQWKSAYEVDNLGYNVYREVNGERRKINSQIIAGSALVTGPNVALTAGRSYAWSDRLNQSGASTQFWLEDIDLKGNSSWNGPIRIDQKSGKATTLDQSALLGKIGVAQSQMTLGQGSVPVERRAGIADLTAAAIQLQTNLAGLAAVKLAVKQEGWYRVSQRELVNAGFKPNIDPRNLQLYADGRPVPMIVKGEQDGRFDPTDSIEFFGLGIDSPVTDSRVYWLAAASKVGTRISSAIGVGQTPAAKSFQSSVERKDRTMYFAALKNGEAENFFGPVIASTPVDQSLSLTNLSPAPGGSALLEVAVQGVTAQSHQVRVTLNGTALGTISFSGQTRGARSFDVPQSSFREGINSVQLMSLGGSADISLVESLRVTYWHSYRVDSNQLRLTAQGGEQVTLSGFTSGGVRVLDVTDPNKPLELPAKLAVGKPGPGTVTVSVPGSGQRMLYAFSSDQAKSEPARLNTPSNWRQAGQGADLVVFTRKDLMASLAPLAAARKNDGLSVAVVDIEDVYDEFSFGHKTPQAIRDFLQFARSNWQSAPRFVLLAGDASYDSKNYLGYGDADLVPTRLIDTRYLEAASDDWFSDFNGDGSAEMATGRLPVRTALEAAVLVAKITGYESSRVVNSVVLASDSADGFDFAAANNLVRPFIPAGAGVTEVRRGSSDDAAVKAQLLASINSGAKVLSYNGHGSTNQWRGNILTSDDARSLTNGQNLTLFVLMTCLNGYFDDPVIDSLAESLLKASNGGAVAVWASTAQSDPAAQSVMHQAFHRELFSGTLTVGEAASRAKSAVSDSDVRRTWILFGDPSMRFK